MNHFFGAPHPRFSQGKTHYFLTKENIALFPWIQDGRFIYELLYCSFCWTRSDDGLLTKFATHVLLCVSSMVLLYIYIIHFSVECFGAREPGSLSLWMWRDKNVKWKSVRVKSISLFHNSLTKLFTRLIYFCAHTQKREYKFGTDSKQRIIMTANIVPSHHVATTECNMHKNNGYSAVPVPHVRWWGWLSARNSPMHVSFNGQQKCTFSVQKCVKISRATDITNNIGV